jgi:hypothetical protein
LQRQAAGISQPMTLRSAATALPVRLSVVISKLIF